MSSFLSFILRWSFILPISFTTSSSFSSNFFIFNFCSWLRNMFCSSLSITFCEGMVWREKISLLDLSLIRSYPYIFYIFFSMDEKATFNFLISSSSSGDDSPVLLFFSVSELKIFNCKVIGVSINLYYLTVFRIIVIMPKSKTMKLSVSSNRRRTSRREGVESVRAVGNCKYL